MRVFGALSALARDIQFIFQSPWIPASRTEMCVGVVQNYLYSVMSSDQTTASPYKGARMKLHDFQQYLGLYRDLFIRHSCGMELDDPRPVILDCGANLGMATLYFKRRFPSARIVAFEPNPDVFALLQENISMNSLTDVSAEEVAVAAQDGEATFVRRTITDPGSFVTLSGVPDGVGSVTVPTVRLSTTVNRLGCVDLLKLDIEGSEYGVLGELEQTRALDKVKACVIEYHAGKCPNPIEEVLSLLSRNRFKYRLRADWKPWFELGEPYIVMIYAKASCCPQSASTPSSTSGRSRYGTTVPLAQS